MAKKTTVGILSATTSGSSETTNLKFTSGGTASADANTLDKYAESSLTLSVLVAGSETGITYSSRDLKYTRIGDLIFFSGSIVLSSKGAGTGAVTITGLPATVATTSAPNVTAGGLAAGIGDGEITAIAFSGGVAINLYKRASGAISQLQDTDISNTSTFRLCGFIHV